MILNDNIKDKIKQHCLITPNLEVCGLIVDNGQKLVVVSCKNISENPERSFLISSKSYLYATTLGKIIGVYHSHPSGSTNFSLVDKNNALFHGLVYIIYDIKTDSFFFYDTKNPELKYVGKNFQLGSHDCFTIVKDFYQTELNIPINRYNYPENWYEVIPSIYEDNFKKEGFFIVQNSPIDVNRLNKYDILMIRGFFKIKYATHTGIYLGQNQILTHPSKQKSQIRQLNSSILRRTKMVLRHERVPEENNRPIGSF